VGLKLAPRHGLGVEEQDGLKVVKLVAVATTHHTHEPIQNLTATVASACRDEARGHDTVVSVVVLGLNDGLVVVQYIDQIDLIQIVVSTDIPLTLTIITIITIVGLPFLLFFILLFIINHVGERVGIIRVPLILSNRYIVNFEIILSNGYV